MTIVVGIDPGVHGAVAVLYDNGPAVWNLPTVKDGKRNAIDVYALGTELATLPSDDCHVFCERVWARNNEGRAGAFSFGRAYGTILGLLAALSLPHDLVVPSVWTKYMGVLPDKDARRAAASRLFPSLAADMKLKSDEHKADALLIAEYGRRRLGALR